MEDVFITIVLAIDCQTPQVVRLRPSRDRLIDVYRGNKYVSLVSIAKESHNILDLIEIKVKDGDENLEYQTSQFKNIEDLIYSGHPIFIWIGTMESLSEEQFRRYYRTVREILRVTKEAHENIEQLFGNFINTHGEILDSLSHEQINLFEQAAEIEREERMLSELYQ